MKYGRTSHFLETEQRQENVTDISVFIWRPFLSIKVHEDGGESHGKLLHQWWWCLDWRFTRDPNLQETRLTWDYTQTIWIWDEPGRNTASHLSREHQSSKQKQSPGNRPWVIASFNHPFSCEFGKPVSIHALTEISQMFQQEGPWKQLVQINTSW